MSFCRTASAPSNEPISSKPNSPAIVPCVGAGPIGKMRPPFGPLAGYSNVPQSAGAGVNNTDDLEELWKACAGPLVYVPQPMDNVWYFPQGHMEQVTALTLQGSCQPLPHSGLDSQILCRVIHRQLSAEVDTDEVFAQVSLLPISREEGESHDDRAQESTATRPKSSVRCFIKILTASDTSTHGGFSVLRKHAEECLPPLDMTQDPPTQDLVAYDLHGKEWPFKHTYRGHPRRHLLTTGWSVFVSHKRLMAGDAVIFLRGENGKLRVGIRRAKRQLAAQQAVLTGHTMHMGVVATARHAVATRSIFSVFYKPRVSHSAYLVPAGKFERSMSVTLSVGMRFKMRFETEDASDRSYAGTVTGIEDLDSSSFPGSKWRSIKVNWDEMVGGDRPDRVSPWEIELSVPGHAADPSPPLRAKRVRQAALEISAVTELSGFGSGSGSIESSYASRLSRALQGKESRTMGMNSLWKSSPHGLSPLREAHFTGNLPQLGGIQVGQSLLSLPSPKSSYYSPLQSASDSDYQFPLGPSSLHTGSSHSLLQGSAWLQPLQSNDSSNWFMSPLVPQHSSAASHQKRHEKSLVTGNVPTPHVAQCQQQQQEQQQHQQQQQKQQQQQQPKSQHQQHHMQSNSVFPSPSAQIVSASEGGCKLFGISLTEFVPSTKASEPAADSDDAGKGNVHHFQSGSKSESEAHKQINSDASSEQERVDEHSSEPRPNHATRSRIKVMRKGAMFGRGIDLSRFHSYEGLLKALDEMFELKGELMDPVKGWKVAYYDEEGDVMLVGDDPWPEFCAMVKRLCIISPEEGGTQGTNYSSLNKEYLQEQMHAPG
ncbi:hypothetical protein KP509_28G004000 [Ceratopteris richardii]|uniref:Auxin response factor n=4 Tax=Ceratopteris richardii TaxID=49495 RepID=A0A8T2RAM0_CERRI|nr:hypothetical protein KP509_28G004000 [Ceratopteris richardii]KAH7292930.1 hypothetical protein KP509_28G004000 [Ceratopteris richardii]KAH7292933.1 hypothetical protein KP509_28G004000 [Ceratopteris richardii]KAH7292935.1 hypothetical protein KP509_28G004000 [Ceratopteris richardii]